MFRLLAAVLATLFLTGHCTADTVLVPVRVGRVITYVPVQVSTPVAPTVVVPQVTPVPVITYVQADGTVILVERPFFTPVRSWIRNRRR